MRKVLLAILLIAVPQLGTAQSVGDFKLSTGRDLLSVCDPAPGSGISGEAIQFCNGFILGTGLLYQQMRRADLIEPWACAEPAPTLSEIRATYIGWAREHPEAMGEAPMDAFWRAMAERWPCS